MSKQQVAGRKKLIKAAGQPPVKKTVAPQEPKGLNSMSNWLILLVLVLPITYSTDVMDSALVPRYIILSGFLCLFTVYFFFLRKRRIDFSADRLLKIIFGVAIGYGLWSLVSLFFAINPAEGYYEVSRSFLNVILLFSIISAIREEDTAALKLCKALTVMAIIQSFVGVLQYYELGFNYLPGNYTPYGLMANRNLFGSGQMYLLPFALFVLYGGSGTWKYISILALTGLVASIVLSQTRSAWLGTAAIFVVAVMLISIYVPAQRKQWLVGAAISLAATALLVSLLLFADGKGTLTSSVKERVVSITKPVAGDSGFDISITDRITTWEKTMEMIRDYPVVGVGAGNWRIGVFKYGAAGTSWSTGRYLPDRPHNVYLLLASETGLPGLLLYASMWILIAVAGFKTIIRSQSLSQKVLIILMLAGLSSFAVDSLFSFATERMEHTLYILMMGGIILGVHARTLGPIEQPKSSRQKILGIALLAVIAVNLIMGFTKNSFEKHARLARNYSKSGHFRESIMEAEAGKTWLATVTPNGDPLEYISAVGYRELKQYDKALEEITRARAYHPYSARIVNTIGNIYTNMKQHDKATPYYEQARNITPNHDVVLKNLAVNYYHVKKYKECLQILDKLDIEKDSFFISLSNTVKKRLAATGQKVP